MKIEINECRVYETPIKDGDHKDENYKKREG
jgi:hypothetical protein